MQSTTEVLPRNSEDSGLALNLYSQIRINSFFNSSYTTWRALAPVAQRKALSDPSGSACFISVILEDRNMDYIEKVYEQGVSNAQFHLDNGEVLSRESNASLSIIMTAGLGALGYVAHLIESNASLALTLALVATSFHLFIIAGLMVRKCLSAEDVMPVHNEAQNLIHPECTWNEVLKVEVKNLQARTEFNRLRNRDVGKWLNGLRMAAFLSPVTFALVWGVALALGADEVSMSAFQAAVVVWLALA